MSQINCPACTMPNNEWTEENGAGVVQDGIRYCCHSCAEGSRVIALFELLESWGRELRKIKAAKPQRMVTVSTRGWRWADPDKTLAKTRRDDAAHFVQARMTAR